MTVTRIHLLALLVVVAHATWADPMVLLGGSAAFVSQDTEANQPWDAEAAGLMAQSYVDLSPSLGAYTAATVGVVVVSHANGTVLDIGQYQTISFNVLLGVGTRAGLDPLGAIAGAGLYFGSSSLNANNSVLSSYSAGGVGAGVGISLLYSLSYEWGIGVNVNAAYYFAVPSNAAPTMAASGFCIFGGIGVTHFFHLNPNTGPGISRYLLPMVSGCSTADP